MNNTAKLGLLLPAVFNPATAAVIGIGLIVVGLYRMLPDDGEEATVDAEAINGPQQAALTVEARLPAVEITEVQPFDAQTSDAEQPDDAAPDVVETAHAVIPEADQSEMIRKAMSELGKRSAAARAKKRAQQDQVR